VPFPIIILFSISENRFATLIFSFQTLSAFDLIAHKFHHD